MIVNKRNCIRWWYKNFLDLLKYLFLTKVRCVFQVWSRRLRCISLSVG